MWNFQWIILLLLINFTFSRIFVLAIHCILNNRLKISHQIPQSWTFQLKVVRIVQPNFLTYILRFWLKLFLLSSLSSECWYFMIIWYNERFLKMAALVNDHLACILTLFFPQNMCASKCKRHLFRIVICNHLSLWIKTFIPMNYTANLKFISHFDKNKNVKKNYPLGLSNDALLRWRKLR